MNIKTGLHNDVNYNGYFTTSIYIITIAVIASGIFVIISKNPILSVLYLILLFLCVSSYLMLLGLNFIGLSYLLVYVGAVSILFLFILMLINIRISEIVTSTSNGIPLGIFISTLFLFTISPALPASDKFLDMVKRYSPYNKSTNNESSANAWTQPLYKSTDNMITSFDTTVEPQTLNLKNNFFKSFYEFNNNDVFNHIYTDIYSLGWDNILSQSNYINSLGNVLYTSYPLWIILTSLVLLLAMVGCIVITIKN